MKKFLIFLVSIIVLVCVGMTTYYFLRNDETINFKTKEIYCNAGDIITLKELGFEHKKADKDTTINYNAGGDAVTSMVNYNAEKGYYVVGDQGGDVTLLIKTSNKKFAEFKVNVHIGNGSESHPYYIDDEATLSKIGTLYGLDKSFELQNDVLVSNSFKTIGYNAPAEVWTGFEGSFNGNGYSISGLKVSALDSNHAGLFSVITETATVKNLIVKNASVEGEFDSVGVFAGEIYGTVSNITVEDCVITSSKAGANVGSIAGVIKVDELTKCKATGVSISAVENSQVGGFAGKIEESFINACYASKVAVNGDESCAIGGFVGEYIIGTEKGSIQQSYANVTSSNENFAGFIAEINTTEDFDVANATMLKTLVGNIAVSNGNLVGTINVPNRADSKPFFPTKDGAVVFEDKSNGFYLISNYATENDLILETSLTFYEVDPEETNTIVSWDANVWINENNMLPELRKTDIRPTSATNDYIRRSLNKVVVDTVEDLVISKNMTYVLRQDIQLPANWTPINLEGNIINGKGFEIRFADEGNVSLFGSVVDSSIKNLKLTNVKTLDTSNGALASTIDSTDLAVKSSIDNVAVEYVGEANGADVFGGLVGTVNNTEIKSCSVKGLNYVGNSNTLAGLVAKLNNSSISGGEISATLNAKQIVGGAVAIINNNSVVSNISGTISINAVTAESSIYAGGVVGENNGTVSESNISVAINIASAIDVYAGGVAYTNRGVIESTAVSGNGITIANEVSGNATLGGIAATNIATINNSKCLMSQVGSFREGKNDTVGGVTAHNSNASSKISQVVAGADLYGNIVAGVVPFMNDSTDASVDQVLVGKFDMNSKAISENTIKGDTFVAGVAVELKAGTISNIQTNSNIVGVAHNTVSSLVVLVFPDGAKLNNAAINNSCEGNGSFYLDSWNDYSGNSSLFDYQQNGYFNLYALNDRAGSFQSVVINTEKASIKGVSGIKESWFTGSRGIYVRPEYENTDESSFYKKASSADFNNIATYNTDWVVNTNSGVFGWGNTEYRKTMTFNFEGIWVDSNGINLAFLNN